MRRKVAYIYLSEFLGTAALVLIGLSVVIFNNGEGSPVRDWLPSPGARRALTGFLFGTTGCLIALSPVGKISGAHINPIVSIAFLLKKRMSLRHSLGFAIMQIAGAVAGALPLLLWGRQGASIDYGATIPMTNELIAAFIGETVTSCLLISGIFFFSAHRRLRRFTPYLAPPLYCIMVYIEGPLSGTSTNPARSFGPAIISGIWTHHWLVYWVAPFLGALLAVGLFSTPFLREWKHILPKLYHKKKTTGTHLTDIQV